MSLWWVPSAGGPGAGGPAARVKASSLSVSAVLSYAPILRTFWAAEDLLVFVAGHMEMQIYRAF